MQINREASAQHIHEYLENPHKTDEKNHKMRLVIDKKDGTKFVNFRPLGTGEQILKFFGFGSGNFKNVIEFAYANKIDASLAGEEAPLLTQQVEIYNQKHNWLHSVLRVDVQSIMRKSLIKEAGSTGGAVVAALKKDDLETVRSMLADSKTKFTSDELKAAFEAAANKGNLEAISSLTRHIPYCFGDRDSRPQTAALFIALQKGNIELVVLLLNEGAFIGSRDDKNNTVLHVAIMNGHNELVPILLSAPGIRYCVNEKNKEGNTPLHEAVKLKDSGSVRELVKYIAPNFPFYAIEKNKDGNTPLHEAVKMRDNESVRELLKYANPNHPNAWGNTPLHIAAYLGDEDVISSILSLKNIDKNPLNHVGKTPRDCARSQHADAPLKNVGKTEALLQAAGCKLRSEISDPL